MTSIEEVLVGKQQLATRLVVIPEPRRSLLESIPAIGPLAGGGCARCGAAC